MRRMLGGWASRAALRSSGVRAPRRMAAGDYQTPYQRACQARGVVPGRCRGARSAARQRPGMAAQCRMASAWRARHGRSRRHGRRQSGFALHGGNDALDGRALIRQNSFKRIGAGDGGHGNSMRWHELAQQCAAPDAATRRLVRRRSRRTAALADNGPGRPQPSQAMAAMRLMADSIASMRNGLSTTAVAPPSAGRPGSGRPVVTMTGRPADRARACRATS